MISSVTGGDEPAREDRLDNIGVTSLDLIELAVRVEQKFGVRVDEATAQGFNTVGDVVAYIDTHAENP
ncbi:hypothetical protein CPHO_03755 [Corynebacterium phocae]|uniref:Carrier domain-containing protein n=1 Tax=Corynebacterium phocae TaxID=161895 RepID=A0A1L7D6F0_9CORY|nr:hypothetical protein CPHO_03755 [Corynebacterium phocae]